MSRNEYRKKKVEDHLKIQKKIIDVAKDIKENCKEGIDYFKDISTNADVFVDNYEKNIQMVELQKPFVYDFSTSQWSSYLTMMNRDKWFLGYLNILNNDVRSSVNSIEQAAKSSGSAKIDAMYISGATMKIFIDVVDKETREKIEEIGVTPTIIDDTTYIINTLGQMFSIKISCNFESISRDWSSSRDEDKYKLLINLRSLIWDQIIQPNNEFRKTEWYKKLGDANFKNRFAKVKFFIIGHKKESEFLDSTLKLIDTDAWNSANCYDNLTTYGKKGGEINKIVETYNDTINLTFAVDHSFID